MKRIHVALFALVFGAYAYFYQAGGWNQNVRFDLTRALVEDHAVAIDRFADNTGDRARKDGHYYCDKAPGVSLVGAVPYAVLHAVAGPPRSVEELSFASWLSTVFAVALPSALGVVALSLLLGALGVRVGPSVALAAAWGLATLAFPYATLYYGHQLAASLLLIAFAMTVRLARGIDPGTPLRLVVIGAIGGWAIVVEYPAALAAVVVGAYAIRRLERRQIAWIVVGAFGPTLVLAWYHTAAFGVPWHLPYDYSTMSERSQGLFMGIGMPRADALWGILVSPFRGLFHSAPWLLLALPGGVRMWRRGLRDETIACAAIVLLVVWMNASLVDWQGGWSVGPRHLVPCLPFLVVLAGGLALPSDARAPKFARVLAALLVGCSAFLMLAITAVQPEVDSAVSAPIPEYVLPRFARGELAASDQSIDMPNRDGHGAHYAWNLGERLGLGGLASLAPLCAWCAVWTWVIVRHRKEEGR